MAENSGNPNLKGPDDMNQQGSNSSYNSGMGGSDADANVVGNRRGTEGLGGQSQGTSSTGTDWGSQQGQALDSGDAGRGSTMDAGSSRISDENELDDSTPTTNTRTES